MAAVRERFVFAEAGRVTTNNAANTQPPRALLALMQRLAPLYDNVHRGQPTASQHTTRLFEATYDDIAAFVGAPGRSNVVLVRNTTEAINTVMYTLLTQFREGDNIVTTTMERNSNFVPWFALCNQILPRLGRRVSLQLARVDALSGELDLAHLASLVDARTKLGACTAASNFLGTQNPLADVSAVAAASGYLQPGGERRSYLLIDSAQWVPSHAVDMQALGADYLAFSFHKMLAPFGVGALVAREERLTQSLPFLYGGDMADDGGVCADRVSYNDLPWEYAAGTPNILGSIVSAQALRLLPDLAPTPNEAHHFDTARPLQRDTVEQAMGRVTVWCRQLTSHALQRLAAVPGLTIYGPPDAARRSALVAFNVARQDAQVLAVALNDAGVKARGGCHCASLAHRAMGIEASCRLSFHVYDTLDDVDRSVDALADVVAGR